MLTVVIPTHNRRALVMRTLQSLAAQTEVAGGFDVVVVCDGSADGTVAEIRACSWPFAIVVLEQPQRGLAAARNRGAREARGDALVFLDDDMVLHPEFLAHIRSVLDAGADGILTTIRQGDWLHNGIISREINSWDSAIHQRLESEVVRFDDIHFCANAIRRDWFEKVNGFDEEFTQGGAYGNEDIELGHRLLLAGAVFRYARAAIAETEAVFDARLLLKRTREVGTNDVRLVGKHPILAAEVFGRKLRLSKIHRVIAPIVLRAPWLGRAVTPLRWAAQWFVQRGIDGKWPYRLWYSVRAVEYWRGVAYAGGTNAQIRGAQDGIA